jgi:hypothetical protein
MCASDPCVTFAAEADIENVIRKVGTRFVGRKSLL